MLFLQIIRWKNLLLIVLIQLLVKYYLIPLFNQEAFLSNFHFTSVVLATVFIAIGGYILNDMYDVAIDKINKPKRVWIPGVLTWKQAKLSYFLLTSFGLQLGITVSLQIQKPIFIGLFVIPVLVLYLYAFMFKKVLIIGNLIVASLVAFSILIIALLEQIDFNNYTPETLAINEVIFGLLIFAFSLNLVREIVKDIEDLKGDKTEGVVSIPIKYGIKTTHKILQVILVLVIGLLIAVAILFYKQESLLVGYLIVVVVSLLLVFCFQLNKAVDLKDYAKLSNLLKLIMLAGVLSVFMINPL